MKLKILIGSLVFLLVASACGINVNLSNDTITGSGNLISETREVSGFDEVVLAGSGELTITQGDEEALTVKTDDNVMRYVRTDVEGDTLVLGFKEDVSVSQHQPVIFTLTVRDLTSVTLAGSGIVEVGALETDKLTVNLPGSGDMRFASIDTASLHVTLAGSGDVQVKGGSAESEEINLLGSGKFLAADFQVKKASVVIAGSGDIEVRSSDELSVKILGSGNVRYYGNPRLVDTNIAGSGDIEKLGD